MDAHWLPSLCGGQPTRSRLAPVCLLGPALPYREIVREGDAPRIELLQPRDPRCVLGMRLPGTIKTPRLQLPRVRRGVVEGLPSDDDATLLRVDHEGLMTRRVARRRDHADATRDLGIFVA